MTEFVEHIGFTDDIILTPETCFSDYELDPLKPYHIFTGPAMIVCVYGRRIYGRSEKELRLKFKKTLSCRQGFCLDDYEIEHGFYARAVHQEESELRVVV